MKKLLYILLFIPLGLLGQVDAVDIQVELGNCKSIEIGDFCFGGIVFYIDETTRHGLVAAPEDIGMFEWGCYGSEILGASHINGTTGKGYQNTMDIVNQKCFTAENENFIAAQVAVDTQIGVYADWFLPSLNELHQMYKTIGNGATDGNIGGFENSFYWSSSEYSDTEAWGIHYLNGGDGAGNKDIPSRVRVIRAF